MGTEMMQELRAVEFRDGVLWLEEIPGDFVEDCLEFSHKDTVIVRNRQQHVLIFSRPKTADFLDLNNKQLAEAKSPDNLVNGVIFDLIFYEPTYCNRNCNFKDSPFPVSFVVCCNSKKYQMSCSESKNIEFLEQNTSEEELVDGSKRNFIFYKEEVTEQFSMFEPESAHGYYLCTEFENGLFKLALRKRDDRTDEETQIEVTPCTPT